jgi:uncharacterized membrane protein
LWSRGFPMASSRFWRRIGETFLAGIAVVLPIWITYLIVVEFLLAGVDGILAPVYVRIFGVRIYGLGVLTTLLLVLAVGALTRNMVGRRLVGLGERILLRIPLVKNVYAASKQFLDAFTVPGKSAFRQVALVEFPREGMYAVGFVASAAAPSWNGDGEPTVNVFVPTAPNPTSGYVVLVPQRALVPLPITVEEGLKLVVSGGIIVPPAMQRGPSRVPQPTA